MDDEDRGDVFTPTGVPAEAVAEAAEAAKVATEKAAEPTATEVEVAKTEEPPRGADGKFAKKERDEDEVRIPKSRFDEQVAKERERAEAAERRLAAIEAKLAATEKPVERGPSQVETLEATLDKLEEARELAIIDGDAKKAAEIRTQIREANRAIARLEAESVAARVTDVRTEEQNVDAAVETLMTAHPALDSKSGTFNPRVVDLVLAEQARLINEKGLTPSAALLKAGTDIMELVTPKAAKEEPKLEDDGKAETERRRLAALGSAVDAAKKQPGALKDTGLDSDKIGKDTVELDPNKLTYKEFDSLPSDQIARMRGDFV